VLVAVSQAVERWRPDRKRGRFRDWLFRIARNAIINYLTRPKHRRIGSGSSEILALLHQQPDPATEATVEFDLEYRRQLFRHVAARVRRTVEETTWQAFWQTSVESGRIVDVAKALNMSSGSVYVARSRVMAKLREEVSRFDDRSDFYAVSRGREHDP
jgi:RNA polymerase sigma-70 factor (ECF subfamily)